MKEKFPPPSSQEVPRRYEPDAEGFESHQLDMDTIEAIPAGDEAYIPGLGPCLGIVLYDPQTREAVAAHLVLRTRLNKVLDQARKTLQDLSRVKVFATGVSPEADNPAI